ncbi:hypothetical protein [Virgibacillus sp. DJP39]|uniref:hypothetical protein n=1 Tax=Virgibacillus sp. DJP39 TaxID=3409790 RepID=UPI003BB62880
MKKNSQYINNEKGFILPLVLLTAALLFLFLSTHVSIYQNELRITKNELAQTKIDTLFQMGRSKFKSELPLLNQESGTVQYTFPDGDVEITYSRKQNIYELLFSIATPDNKQFIIANHMAVILDLNK